MALKQKKSDYKEYFIKNREGFLFSSLFASNELCANFSKIVEKEVDIIPIAIFFAPLSHIHSFGKNLVLSFKFQAPIEGTTRIIADYGTVSKLAKKTGIDHNELLRSVFNSVNGGAKNLLDRELDPASVESHYVNCADFPVKNENLRLWIRYAVTIPREKTIFLNQTVSTTFLESLSRFYTHQTLPDNLLDDLSFLAFLRELNKAYQAKLLASLNSLPGNRVTLGGISGKAGNFSFEELRLAPDRAIQSVLEESARRRIHQKDQAIFISSLSDELRGKFMQNMSKNRKSEVRDLIKRIEPDQGETMRVQQEFAWIILDIASQEESLFPAIFRSRMKKVIAAINEKLVQTAEHYLSSGEFQSTILPLDKVMLQLVMRRAPRKELVNALSYAGDEVMKIVDKNVSQFGGELLQEDIEHYSKSVEDENDRKIAAASSQRLILREAHSLKKELARNPF